MIIKAKFLALAKDSFISTTEADNGKVITYYRLHVFDPIENEYLKLPIKGTAADACIAQGTKFGDDLELNASYEPEREKDPIRIIQW